MDKEKLIAALFELSQMISPRDPKELLVEFGKETMRRFGFTCFEADVPAVGFSVRIPDSPCSGREFVGNAIKVKIGGVEEIYWNALQPVLKRLDDMVGYLVLSKYIFEESPDVIVIVDEDCNVIAMNRKAREVLGDVTKLDRNKCEGVYEKDGRYYHAVTYDLGAMKAIVARDVTELKRLEERARELEEWFRTLAEFTPVAVLVYQDGKYRFANRAAEEITGYSREELVSGDVFKIFRDEDRDLVREMAKRRLSGERVPPYTIRIRRKDGSERIVQVYGSRVTFGGKPAGIVAAVDVTEIEEERRRMSELTKMLGLINKILRHDVLNVLTSAMAYLDLYEETKNEEYLKKLRDAIEKCTSIVKNIRSFEDVVRRGELKCVNVRKILDDVVRFFHVDICIRGDCEVIADEGLRAIFENIINNAVIHSGTDRIEIDIKGVGDWCEVRIADYGKGIPDEIKERIFEEGFKYGEKAQTGVGLYIVKRLVERYGGGVRVEDNYPSGTVFVIRLRRC